MNFDALRRLGLQPFVLGAGLLLAVGIVVTVAMPMLGDDNTRLRSNTRRYNSVGADAGRGVYQNQGCIYCHTQQVRDTYSDAGLASRPTRPDDISLDRPAQLGAVRYGPDLSCVGDRVPGLETPGGEPARAGDQAAREAEQIRRVDAMIAYLRAPSEVHHGSTMPSYAHLSGTDLRRLAIYLTQLRCDSPGGIAVAGQ